MTAFRTHTDRFVEADAQVLGISVDSFAAAGEFDRRLTGELGVDGFLAGEANIGDRPLRQRPHDAAALGWDH